ncbi:hypothetical protein ACQ4PT_038763 [Festuca glaucescens]
MEGSFLAPAVHDAPSHLCWVLLDKNAYCNDYSETCFDDCDNATTAHGVTSGGRTIKITFHLANPLAVSTFCFHETEEDFDDDEDPLDDPMEVEVMSSAKDLVLFRPSTHRQANLSEYLVYQAACHRTNNTLPTLKLIPAIHPSMSYPAILPCDDDREFLIADLSATPDRGRYILDVFSSKTDKWVTWPLQLESPLVVAEDSPPDKVIVLGGGVVGWINIWRGILVCNVLDEHPVLRFIPLPKPGIDLHKVDDLQMVRDVTCCDGIIKFVEMDSRFKKVPRNNSRGNKMFYGDREGEDIIYDSELLLEGGSHVEYAIISDGWKIRTCYRHISWDYWRMGHVVDSDDIEIDNPRFSMVLPQPKDYNTQRPALNNLALSYPTLSACGDDVVYMCSMTYSNKWMVGIHLGTKRVEVIEKLNDSHFEPSFLPCTFSNV